jgi:hypothetical protein
VLGIVIGLLVDALMLLFLNEWLAILIVPILLPIIIGIVLGILVMRKLPTLSWWYLIGVIVVGYFLIGAPSKLVHWRLVTMADALPVYPGAELTSRLVIEGCSDNSAPWVSSKYRVNAPADKVREYMMQEFGRTWRKDTGFGDTFYSPSGTQRVVVHADSDSTLEIYMEVFEFCGKR